MSVGQFQKLIALLCVDSHLRKLFSVSREQVYGEFDISKQEMKALSLIDIQKLDLYAKALISKRFKKVKGVFGLSMQVAGKEALVKIFSDYCQLNPRNSFSNKKEVEEFGTHLLRVIANKNFPAYLGDLVNYELTIFSLMPEEFIYLEEEDL